MKYNRETCDSAKNALPALCPTYTYYDPMGSVHSNTWYQLKMAVFVPNRCIPVNHQAGQPLVLVISPSDECPVEAPLVTHLGMKCTGPCGRAMRQLTCIHLGGTMPAVFSRNLNAHPISMLRSNLIVLGSILPSIPETRFPT